MPGNSYPAAQTIVPKQLNPELNQALQIEATFFCKHGYLVIDDALTEAQVQRLRSAVDRCFSLSDNPHTEGLRHRLLEVDREFHFLLDHEPVMRRIEAILGTCVQLHSASAQFAKPGSPDQIWHRDGPWPMDPRGTPYGSLPGQINCGYYLDELSEETGPIKLVPFSHRSASPAPNNHDPLPDELAVYARPGQAVLFDGWLWHRRAANTGSKLRRVCLMCYQNAWMKSREPFDGPLVRELITAGDARRKLLLGQVPSW
jgi:ectoine hydroxylase-related dioxygenase (phytanoyl-CoA dioxygenase family)